MPPDGRQWQGYLWNQSLRDEASHFVSRTEEGSAKVRWVVEEKDLLPEVSHEEKIVRLVESYHFLILGGFEIHGAVETSDVAVS